MVERVSWAVGSDTERILTVEDARIAWAGHLTPAGAVTTRSGFRPTGNADPGRVFATSPTPNGTVHVEPFTYHLQSQRGGGVYTMTLDAVKDFDILTTAPPDATNARNDLIIAQQSDLFFGDPDSRMRIRHIAGNPSASPQDPQITGSPDFIRLARIVVQANATAITPADIQGLRPVDRATVALGGLLPIPDQAARTAIANPYDGMPIYRRDRDWVEVYDGTAWRVAGIAHCASASDRDTAITDPYPGQLAVTTDSSTVWIRRTTAWERYPRGLIARARRTTNSNPANSSAHVPVLRVDNIAVRAGRAYIVKTSELNPETSDATTTYRVTIRFSTSGPATPASPVLPGAEPFDFRDGSTAIETSYIPATNHTLSVLLCIARINGSGTARLLADPLGWIELFVYDEGIDIGDTGTGNTL